MGHLKANIKIRLNKEKYLPFLPVLSQTNLLHSCDRRRPCPSGHTSMQLDTIAHLYSNWIALTVLTILHQHLLILTWRSQRISVDNKSLDENSSGSHLTHSCHHYSTPSIFIHPLTCGWHVFTTAFTPTLPSSLILSHPFSLCPKVNPCLSVFHQGPTAAQRKHRRWTFNYPPVNVYS